MAQRLIAKGVPERKIAVIPPWSHDAASRASGGPRGVPPEHGLDGKFVVMYSGNHSPCHPLDTRARTPRFAEEKDRHRLLLRRRRQRIPQGREFASATDCPISTASPTSRWTSSPPRSPRPTCTWWSWATLSSASCTRARYTTSVDWGFPSCTRPGAQPCDRIGPGGPLRPRRHQGRDGIHSTQRRASSGGGRRSRRIFSANPDQPDAGSDRLALRSACRSRLACGSRGTRADQG